MKKSAGFHKHTNQAIHLKEQIELNGKMQGIIIKGNSLDNPLLLFLHGGPGIPNYPTLERTSAKLEEEFTVCYWDQRGTGMSFGTRKKGFESTEQLVKDTIQLTKYLSRKYKKDKIYLLAHSWGTIIGMRAVAELPESYHAYMGIGQLGVPSKVMGSKKHGYREVFRKIMKKGRSLLKKRYTYIQLARDIIKHPDLTAKDKWCIFWGILFAYPTLIREIVKGSLRALPFQLKIPAYFFVGNQDLPMTATLGGKYIENIQAPVKRVYCFKKSAHYPFLEEPERFLKIIMEEVLEQ